MKVIHLDKENKYHDWKIVSQRKVNGSHGKCYTELTYLKPGKDIQSDPLAFKIGGVVLFVFAGIATFGILFLVSDFRNKISCAAAGEFYITDSKADKKLKRVYSKVSLEEHLWNQIKCSTWGKVLYQKAKKAQKKSKEKGAATADKISLKLLPWGSLTLFGKNSEPWPAQCSYTLGRISIALKHREDDMLGSLVFELGNLFLQKRFRQLDRQVKNGDIASANKYAKKNERIEYDTALIHDAVITTSVAEGKWKRRMLHNLYAKSMGKTFKEDWKLTKHTAHAEHYRQQFKWLPRFIPFVKNPSGGRFKNLGAFFSD